MSIWTLEKSLAEPQKVIIWCSTSSPRSLTKNTKNTPAQKTVHKFSPKSSQRLYFFFFFGRGRGGLPRLDSWASRMLDMHSTTELHPSPATLLLRAKSWNNPNVYQWRNKMWYIIQPPWGYVWDCLKKQQSKSHTYCMIYMKWLIIFWKKKYLAIPWFKYTYQTLMLQAET
jgi:hypothetical protein